MGLGRRFESQRLLKHRGTEFTEKVACILLCELCASVFKYSTTNPVNAVACARAHKNGQKKPRPFYAFSITDRTARKAYAFTRSFMCGSRYVQVLSMLAN